MVYTLSLDIVPGVTETKKSAPKPPLKFRKTRHMENISIFKILQLADLHFGENQWMDWGPQQDQKSIEAIQYFLQAEKPDLVILSGDQITGLNVDANATSYYEQIIESMLQVDENIKWATIFGNHDDESYSRTFVNGTTFHHQAKTSRKDLIDFDMGYVGSYTLQGEVPSGLFGTSNYMLSLFSFDMTKHAANIYFFDSGGGSLPEMNGQNQVEWFQSKQRVAPNGETPSIAFQHIPTPNEVFQFREDCIGHTYEGVDPVVNDSGLLEALSASGNMRFFAVGHNHGNDYCCPTESNLFSICYGRHSGYGGYNTIKGDGNTWSKGTRVYLLQINQEGIFSWFSYVRMKNGHVTDVYKPL